jgi:hypothetical protein
MGKTKAVTYECEKCGSEIVVTSTGDGELSPIYCCGIEVTEITIPGGKSVSPKKKQSKKASVRKATSKKGETAKKRKARK